MATTINRLSERTKSTQKPPRFMGKKKKKPGKTGGVLATMVFRGSMGRLGGYILGWFSSVWPLIVATVRTLRDPGINI